MTNEVPALRRVVAVAAGFFASTVMSLGGDIAFRQLSPGSFDAEGHPVGDATLAVIMAYEAVFAAVAGYVTARLAIRQPLTHALITGVLILLARAFTVFVTWSTAPAWFHLGTLLLIVPLVLLGAKVGELRTRSLQ